MHCGYNGQGQKPLLPFEDSAVQMTVTGWVCKTCGRFCGKEERLARWCCAKDLPCETEGCTRRAPKGYLVCDECRHQKELARWKALPEVEWDGATPLALDDDDTYFIETEDLDSYLDDLELKVEDVRLVVCVQDHKPRFDVMDLLTDYLPDGLDCDENPDAINKVINIWIDENVPVVWVHGKTRPSDKSLRAALGVKESA